MEGPAKLVENLTCTPVLTINGLIKKFFLYLTWTRIPCRAFPRWKTKYFFIHVFLIFFYHLLVTFTLYRAGEIWKNHWCLPASQKQDLCYANKPSETIIRAGNALLALGVVFCICFFVSFFPWSLGLSNIELFCDF